MVIDNTMVIHETKAHVKKILQSDSSGHDWWHIHRVYTAACYIAKKENANLLIVELAALLHDIADWKFHDNDLSSGAKVARQWLKSLNIPDDIIEKICHIVEFVSFKGAGTKQEKLSLEGQIVQDADRLDAMGAIGIGRTFAYGGYKGRQMHDPHISSSYHKSFEDYKNNKGTTINHFHEKLFLLKDRMNTDTSKQLAEQKHQYMEQFLEQFLKEWSAEYQ